jgi:hypothetical protein
MLRSGTERIGEWQGVSKAGRRTSAVDEEAKRITGIDLSKLLSWYDEFCKPMEEPGSRMRWPRALRERPTDDRSRHAGCPRGPGAGRSFLCSRGGAASETELAIFKRRYGTFQCKQTSIGDTPCAPLPAALDRRRPLRRLLHGEGSEPPPCGQLVS